MGSGATLGIQNSVAGSVVKEWVDGWEGGQGRGKGMLLELAGAATDRELKLVRGNESYVQSCLHTPAGFHSFRLPCLILFLDLKGVRMETEL